MEKLYAAIYYDGKTTNKQQVLVSIEHDGLSIIIQQSDTTTNIKWENESIQVLEQNSTQLSLRHGANFPFEQLDISDSNFIKLFKHRNLKSLTYNKNLFLWATIFLIVSLIWLSYSYLLPAAIDQIAMKVPTSYEEKLGKTVLDNVLSTVKIDTAKSESLNAFFKHMNIESEYTVKIYYIKDDLVNAFALPGGSILVFEGLAKKLKNESQLAALLAHEYSHISKRHATRNLFRSLSGYILLSVVTGDMNGVAQQIFMNAQQIYELSYNREMENEADLNGLELMKDNHIHANGMKGLFKVLQSETYMNPPEILSTHPDIENRIKTVDDFLSKNTYTSVKNDSLIFYFKQMQQW